ncbi:MAG TPA: PAS domain-containing protein [Gemmatimonadaceae bacterium]
MLAQLVPGLARVLGERSEVVLHDFSDPKHSLVAIAGNLTGRKIGAPLTDRLLETYRTYGDAAPDLIGLRTRTRDGRLLRSSTLFVRDARGRIVGSIGFNVDLSDLEVAFGALGQMLGRGPGNGQGEQAINFATDIKELMNDLIEQELDRRGVAPQLLDRSERLEVVRALERHGLFKIKGSVQEVARRLGVSPYTVYGYLDEVRKEATS